ncbi:poly [ADP-ribose] polymerase 12-like isoform X3 [Anopheles sinensis]|uniref:Poly [ADP-ribose] polymerase 12-like isoform X3 n=1 Tax=Anopheles sinensis TaxID=74873 RepID=A0A084VKQ8_ANOSI|nr:poly [ADP-ribose] polymerase 12-like isoform X3 [Anopheles sinensis]
MVVAGVTEDEKSPPSPESMEPASTEHSPTLPGVATWATLNLLIFDPKGVPSLMLVK